MVSEHDFVINEIVNFLREKHGATYIVETEKNVKFGSKNIRTDILLTDRNTNNRIKIEVIDKHEMKWVTYDMESFNKAIEELKETTQNVKQSKLGKKTYNLTDEKIQGIFYLGIHTVYATALTYWIDTISLDFYNYLNDEKTRAYLREKLFHGPAFKLTGEEILGLRDRLKNLKS